MGALGREVAVRLRSVAKRLGSYGGGRHVLHTGACRLAYYDILEFATFVIGIAVLLATAIFGE